MATSNYHFDQNSSCYYRNHCIVYGFIRARDNKLSDGANNIYNQIPSEIYAVIMIWYQDGHHRALIEEIGNQIIEYVKSYRRCESLLAEKLLLTPPSTPPRYRRRSTIELEDLVQGGIVHSYFDYESDDEFESVDIMLADDEKTYNENSRGNDESELFDDSSEEYADKTNTDYKGGSAYYRNECIIHGFIRNDKNLKSLLHEIPNEILAMIMHWYQNGAMRIMVKRISESAANYVKTHRRRESLFVKLLLSEFESDSSSDDVLISSLIERMRKIRQNANHFESSS